MQRLQADAHPARALDAGGVSYQILGQLAWYVREKMAASDPRRVPAAIETLFRTDLELKRSGEFVLPGMVKLVVQKRKARMGRNPATGEAIKIPAKTVVKARIAKQLKDTVLPKK